MAEDRTEQAVEEANARADQRRIAYPRALNAQYDRQSDQLVIGLSSGFELRVSPRQVEGLEHGSPETLQEIVITPSGYGLHVPALDADVYVPGLLDGLMGSKSWMARTLGRRGGAITSDAKRRASRANGTRGGRPRKTADS